jgi:proteasome lid subunit RPN8/RPN11
VEAAELSIEVESGGVVLERHPVSPAACFEDVLFRSVVEDRVPNDGAMPEFELAAEWLAAGPPRAGALILSHARLPEYRYPRDVFAPQARYLIRSLVRQERLAAEAPVEWHLVVRPDEAERAEIHRSPFPLTRASLPTQSVGSLVVEVDAGLLDKIQRRVVRAGATERAAMLLGRVLHDPTRGAALVQLQDEIPLAAGSGGASQAHFAFDPAGFVSARREAAGRTDGLVPVGWEHSHPPCEACLERPSCPTETVFFSASDVEVHAAAFPSAFMVGLVAGKLSHLPARRPGFRLYGWRDAQVVPLPFTVTGPAAEAFRAEVVPVPHPEERT